MKTKDLVALEQLLMVQPQFGRIKVEGDLLTAFLSEPMEAASVNKLLFEKGIVLSHLVKRKESLEEQFLPLPTTISKSNSYQRIIKFRNETTFINRIYKALE